ncbi:MAG: hypothetical protein KBG42_04405 [Lachnospiraceae bacterium]|nr:hypothetical protein [Lachnospiraceae bacterium]
MNNKISEILIGITAVISAGVISIIPASSAQAAIANPTAAASNETHEIKLIDDIFSNSFSGIIPGTVQWSYSGVSDYTIINNSQILAICPSIPVEDVNLLSQSYPVLDITGISNYNSVDIIIAGTVFVNDPGEASGTAVYDFTYNGVSYSGALELSQMYPKNLRRLNGIQIIIPVIDNGPEEFRKSINDKVTEIELAVKGLNADGSIDESKTVEYNCKGAINHKIIEALAKAEGVTLIYTFEYQGYVFTSTITSADAAKMYSPDIDWYGPCYIANNCPTAMIGVVE